jgi:hypothetical protein
VKSSDCRTIGRSPGSIRRGKCWESGWASAMLGGGTVGSRSSGGFDWSLPCGFHKLPWSHCWSLGSLPPYDGGGGGLGPFNPVLGLCEVASSQLTALLGVSAWKSLSANWGGWGHHSVLMQFVLGQGFPLQCPCNSLLWPGFHLRPSGLREAWAKLYSLYPKSSTS